jgi:hypothetical protein
MTPGEETSLAATLIAAARDLQRVESHDADDTTEWTTEGVVFAAVGPQGADFRLARQVADAALRTPDAERSPRGPEWVRFAPTQLDGHALDRATAWLASAWRRADAER